jgi:hypothetical protein
MVEGEWRCNLWNAALDKLWRRAHQSRSGVVSLYPNQTLYCQQDFHFTTKGETLYAIEMAWPKEGEALIHTLSSDVVGARKVNSVSLLGAPAELTFTQRTDGLHIKVPVEAPGKYAYVYRINFRDVKALIKSIFGDRRM